MLLTKALILLTKVLMLMTKAIKPSVYVFFTASSQVANGSQTICLHTACIWLTDYNPAGFDDTDKGDILNGLHYNSQTLKGHIVAERNANGGVMNRFDRGIGQRMVRSEHHGWYLHNIRGDVIQRVNIDVVVIQTYRYSAFGLELNYSASNSSPFRFAGMYWDSHTQTHMTPNRHFSPRLGRWTQPDPYWGIHNFQNCPASIFQSANLFLYTMHNPVMWVDPTGLLAFFPGFSWNEDSDHWFNMATAVPASGGTMSASVVNGIYMLHVTIFGVTVTFNTGMDGVLRIPPGRFTNYSWQVRADTFYSIIVGAATEMIFLGAHGGIIQSNPIPHLHISMFVSQSSSYWNHAYFEDYTRWGNVRYAFISGSSCSGLMGNAISQVNRMAYLDRPGLQYINHLYTGKGMISGLFEAHAHFMDFHRTSFWYAPLPVPAWLSEGFNSTSITLSLLNSVGLDHGMTSNQLRWAVGANRHIHPRYFGN